MRPRIPYLLLLLLVALSTIAFSQSGAGTVEVSTKTERTFANPYYGGESLEYEGKYKRFGFAFSIAELVFKVTKNETDGTFYIFSEARSKGTLTKLFNFKFYQKIESTVNSDSLQVVSSVKRDEQKERIRDSEANFDYLLNRVTWIETDPNEPTRPPKRVASTITQETQDMVTGVFMLRGKELAVGKRMIFKISDSGLVYDVPVRITGRERQKSILGKVQCWKIEPEIFGDGRIIEQKGGLIIWMTDDERRIPVRARLDTELGRVDIKLVRYVAPVGLATKNNTSQ